MDGERGDFFLTYWVNSILVNLYIFFLSGNLTFPPLEEEKGI